MTAPLISVKELAALKPEKTVIFDCRFSLQDLSYGKRSYSEGHIPGAYRLDLNEHLSSSIKPHGGRHPLPDTQRLCTTLRDAGVSPLANIVVYDDQRCAFAARAWWLLNYLGLTQVQILNGGYSAWIDASRPVDRRAPAPQTGHFHPQEKAHWVCDYKQVKAMIGDKAYALIDAREPKRYRGEEEPIDPVAGRIPGALNYPWQDTTDENGYVKSELFQASRWKNLPRDSQPIVYCGSGVTACVDILSLVLSDRYTLDEIRLYAGSWSDWCSYGDAVQKSH